MFSSQRKASYAGAADEEVSGTAQQLFDTAQAAENSGNHSRAIKAISRAREKVSQDTLAAGRLIATPSSPGAMGDSLKAAAAYRVMVENYPKDPALRGSD